MTGEMLSVQARGGYGGGGYGGGGYGGGSYGASDYGYEYVDPYVVLASLGFGVFLFNIIYNLLNRSTRSLDVSDINLPLDLSDRPERFHQILENISQQQEYQSWTEVDDQPESSHRLLLLKKSVRVGQRVAEAIRRHPAFCPKSLLCNIGNDEIAWNRQPAIVLRAMQLYITSLAHHYGHGDTARYVDQLEKQTENEMNSVDSCDASPEIDCGLDDLMSLL